MPGPIVIVGASLAGLRTAEALRTKGYEGAITVIGAEAHLPYDRPPLSKRFLTDDREPDVGLRSPERLGELGADFELGSPAAGLDSIAHTVTLESGESFGYGAVVLATGATPRRLPGTEGVDGIHVLRTVDDARSIRAGLDDASRVVVVGAGFIGAEIAASIRARGVDVTVVEYLAQPLLRGLGPELGAAAADWYRARGVDLRLGTGVTGFATTPVDGRHVGDSGTAVQDRSRRDDSAGRMGESESGVADRPTGRVVGVEIDTGETLPADLVVVGIGVVPATDWLAGSGLTIDDGVVCDQHLAAVGVDDVWAVGDIARWPHPRDGNVRLEHWTSATETAGAVAGNLLARSRGEALTPHAPVPYVWSDQFDTKIQIVGHVGDDDAIEVVRGSTAMVDGADPRFVALAHRDGVVSGVVGFSEPRRVVMVQMAMERGPLSLDEAREIAG